MRNLTKLVEENKIEMPFSILSNWVNCPDAGDQLPDETEKEYNKRKYDCEKYPFFIRLRIVCFSPKENNFLVKNFKSKRCKNNDLNDKETLKKYNNFLSEFVEDFQPLMNEVLINE